VLTEMKSMVSRGRCAIASPSTLPTCGLGDAGPRAITIEVERRVTVRSSCPGAPPTCRRADVSATSDASSRFARRIYLAICGKTWRRPVARPLRLSVDMRLSATFNALAEAR
jgi:hypothetical protein